MHYKISVCIPTYNGEKYIGEQLESILKQLDMQDEVIIYDDKSTDHTLEVVRRLNDNRIRIYNHSKEHNPYRSAYKNIYYVYKNVENALQHATGNIIFLSDQDDIWLPGKVKRIVQEFRQGADLVLHDNIVVDAQCRIICRSYFEHSHPSMNPLRILFRCYFQGASMAFSEHVKNKVLPFPSLPVSHDHWIAINAYFRKQKIAIIREQLMLYRRHEDNVSPSTQKSPNSLCFKIGYRLFLLRAAMKVWRYQ